MNLHDIHLPELDVKMPELTMPNFDTDRLESMLGTVTETITDDIVPAARGGVRRTIRVVRGHPRASVGTVLTVLGLLGLVLWLRRRSASEQQPLHLADDAAASAA